MSHDHRPRRGTLHIDRISLTGAAPTPPAPSEADAIARDVVARMLAKDAFSQWLGIKVLDVADTRAVIQMTVRPERANGFGFAHGGIAFAFADSAHAFCSNSAGEISVATDCHISYPAAIRVGDVLTATAEQRTESNRLGFSDIVVRNQDGEVVALFKGTVYRTRKSLP